MQGNEEQGGKSGKYGVMANAVNFIGGVSFLGLPFAVKESGLIGGLLLLGLVAILTEASHRLIVESSKFHHKLRWLDIDSYEALVAVPFGRYGELLLLFSVFVVAFGATVEFTVMIKDLLSTLLVPYLNGGGTIHLLILAWAVLIVPLTLIKDLSSLTFVSVLSLGLSAFLLAVIIEEAPFRENIANNGGLLQVIKDYSFRPHVFTTFSIFTEVFAWQHGIFQFFQSLRRADIRRWRFVTSRVNTTISIIYILVSVPAYLAYLDNTTGDIFLSLPSQGAGSTLTDIARICFLFICIMTYPLEMLVARDVMKALLARPDEDSIRINHSSPSFFRFFLSGRDLAIVLCLDVGALGLGILFKDLGDTCALVGAIGGSLASFIIPGLVYLGVNGQDFTQWTNTLLLGQDVISSQTHSSCVKLTDSSKPWWFYVLGFPIWCYVADWGATSVELKLHSSNATAQEQYNPAGNSSISFDNQDDDSRYSDYIQYDEGNKHHIEGKRGTRGKFLISITLIFVGFVTLVVGIVERF